MHEAGVGAVPHFRKRTKKELQKGSRFAKHLGPVKQKTDELTILKYSTNEGQKYCSLNRRRVKEIDTAEK